MNMNGDEYHRVIALRHGIPLGGELDAVRVVEEAESFSDKSLDSLADLFLDLADFIRSGGKDMT